MLSQAIWEKRANSHGRLLYAQRIGPDRRFLMNGPSSTDEHVPGLGPPRLTKSILNSKLYKQMSMRNGSG